MKLKKLKNQLTKEFKRTKKLWKIHRIALLDLRSAERSPTCTIKMSVWMSYSCVNKKCTVCMAGAVMRRRFFDEVIDKTRGSQYVPASKINNKMRAIDYLRTGDVKNALFYLKGPEYVSDIPPDRIMPPYEYKSQTWWKAQWKLNRELRKANI